MRKFVELKADDVRKIYPGTRPEIISDEDGFVAFNFRALYPSNLAVFTPKMFPLSRYSNALPANFEGAFEDLDAKVSLVSRTLEVPIKGKYEGNNIEFATGKVLKRDGIKKHYTVFQIGFVDRIDDSYKEMLCRAPFSESLADELKKDRRISTLASTMDLSSRKEYLYWIMPFSSLFDDSSPLISAIFKMALI